MRRRRQKQQQMNRSHQCATRKVEERMRKYIGKLSNSIGFMMEMTKHPIKLSLSNRLATCYRRQ